MNDDEFNEILDDGDHPIAWFAVFLLGAVDLVLLGMLVIPALLFLHTKSAPQ